MNNIFEEIRFKPANWVKAAGYLGAILMVYYSALIQLVRNDWRNEDYSHCSLIPLVVLYFIWEKRKRLAKLPSVPSVWGFLPFLLGIGLYWVGELGGEYFTMYFSMWLVIVGLAWSHLGGEKVRTIGFALTLMLAMFPFPNFINVRISLLLQLVSSKLGVWMMQLYGMSAYREGNVIDLGFTQLQVVEACSGLRYIMPTMIISLILAYWFRAQLWKRAFLFLSAIPLAIFMNSFRIATTGVLYEMLGPKVSEDFFHGFSGWLLFVTAIALLLLEMWLMRFIGMEAVKADCGKAGNYGNGTMQQRMDAAQHAGFLTPLRLYAVTMLLLLLTFAASYGVEFREKVPVKKAFNEFPMGIGEWTGSRQSMEKEFINALPFSDYIMANYRDQQGREIDFYVAYYESQLKGETTHSPETCLPGNGWTFEPAGLANISNGDGQVMAVNRTWIEKSGSRQLSYFWFPQRGRILTSLIQVKWFAFWDALTRQRTDGALVRLTTPIYPSEGPDDAENRLNGFAGEVAGVLAGFLPS